jgi:hypothetical protein
VVVVWGPDPRALAAASSAGAHVRTALPDQGHYARGHPFDAVVLGDSGLDPDVLPGADVWAWRVDEHVPLAGDPATCAVTLVSLMRRNPELTHDEFAAHWRERHAPLALRHHVGAADYRQLVVREPLTAATPAIDGVAMLGFGTRADFDDRFYDSDAGRAAIRADVARFMDRRASAATLVGPPWRSGGPG